MSRRVFIGLLVIAVAFAVAWVAWPSGDAPAAAASDAPERETALNSKVIEQSAAPRMGAIAGVVRFEGRGVAKARVTVKGGTPLATETLDDGAFRVDGVPPGPVFVAAGAGDRASGVLGPFMIEPGKTVDGLVLELGPTVTIDGIVRDLITRAPISRAIVSWSGGTTQTDEKGAFRLPAPPSQVWLDVMARGYLPRTEWVSLELAKTGGKLDLSLSLVSAIEGHVLEQGTPRVGVSVWAEFTQGLRRGERSALTVTNGKGEFRIECSEGLRRVIAVTPAGVTVPGPEVRVAVGETHQGVVVELGELGPLSGVVRRDGEVLPAASLTLINAFTEDTVATTSTLLDGRFDFGPVPAGRYLAQVRLGAFTTIAGPHDHQRGGNAWPIEVKGGAVLSGRVEPAAAGVRVRWRTGDWAGPSSETVTDAEGAFRFEGVPGKEVLVDAEGPQGAATATAKAGTPVVLHLQRGSVRVRVVDANGAAVTDAVVLARSEETGASRKYVLMAPDGVFVIDLPQGRWVVLAEVAGRGRTTGQTIAVTPAATDVTLTLMSTRELRGVVIDQVSRLPITGARVRASSEVGQVTVTTDTRGNFQLPPQPERPQIFVGREGFEPQQFVADSANLTIELKPRPNQPYQDDAPRFEGVGMVLRVENNRVMVQTVNEASPAERAGVHAGDVIVAIDGTPAGGDLPAVVNRIRGPAGTPVSLSFERQGQQREVVMRRKSLLISYW